jgi:beta-glucanase (GH16 family)
MTSKSFTTLFVLLIFSEIIYSQNKDLYNPDFSTPPLINGMKLVWSDEFNISGKPDTATWKYEKGFIRNQELQWYQSENAVCRDGLLIIEGKKEKVRNPFYNKGSANWKANRKFAKYTSASIRTRGMKQFQFGRFEIRARIDTAYGSWPAIWTLGSTKPWPSSGEIDIMEFYRVNHIPTILANFAWGTNKRLEAKWADMKKPLADFIEADPSWTKKFHIWRMDWNKESISIFLDDQLLNTILLDKTVNPDGFNPFLQPHYIMLNLAIGANGGDPSKSKFPIKFEVDYVRVYQKE